MSDFIFNLGNDSTLYKLNELILKNCVSFNCGVDDLNEFFSNDALAYERDLMGKTYCWLDNSDDRKIIAMIKLANAGIQTTHLPNNPKRHLNKTIAYIKRLRKKSECLFYSRFIEKRTARITRIPAVLSI